jgi:hypothetical protein
MENSINTSRGAARPHNSNNNNKNYINDDDSNNKYAECCIQIDMLFGHNGELLF